MPRRLRVLPLEGAGARTEALATYLGSKPGTHAVTPAVPGDLLASATATSQGLGARADQADVPAQHVEELRELAQTAATEHAAHAGDARIAPARPSRVQQSAR